MSALRFTARGAVPLPDALQLRVGAAFESRLVAGAGQPGRSLTVDEVEANVHHFTESGPRRRAVTRLALSGLAGDDPLLARIAGLRARGIERVVIHADPGSASACASVADQVAVVARTAEDLVPLAGLGGLAVTVPLEAAVLPVLGSLLSAVRALRPERVVLAWPFPAPGALPPAPAEDVVAAIEGCGTLLHGLPFTLKGLPACVLTPLRRSVPDLGARTGRTSNRWYVDADHQLDRALLFVPDVVRFAKAESCRFCEVDTRCDGVAEAWWRLGLAGALLPLRHGEGVDGGGSAAG